MSAGPDQGGVRLALCIYFDGLTGVVTRNRELIKVESYSFGSVASQEKEIQSDLDVFYESFGLGGSPLQSVDLIFINSIFHRTKNAQMETYKNRLPSFLLYHKEFFAVPVRHDHIANILNTELSLRHEENGSPELWFHLRKNILFVSFCTAAGEVSITSFEVHKTLDVYYYILFNYQTLQRVLPDLEQIVISGELMNMDKIHNFFEENIPDVSLTSYWQWINMWGKPPLSLNPYLPEVNIK